MADLDDVALEGGEQTHAPVPAAPAPSEPAPHETAKQTVRRAFEQAQAKAAERDERERAPRPPQGLETDTEGSNEGKPAVDRTRDPHGRFVRGEGQERPQVERPAQEAPEAPEAPEPEAPVGLVLRPPPGWSAAARSQFGMLPPEVKEAVAKREADVATGMQVLQHYKGLETYTPSIEASGISHAEFTKRAVEWEQSLRTNPIGTLMHVARLGNIDMLRLAGEIIQQAQQRGQQVPPAQAAQQAYSQSRPQEPPQDFRALARQEARQELIEREADTVSREFVSDPKNIYLDEPLIEDMALLITNNRADSLEQAYEMACWARPEIRAVLIRQAGANPGSVSETDRARRTASEARSAAKATVGAPSGPRPEPKDDRPPNAPVRYDVRRAFQQVLDRQT